MDKPIRVLHVIRLMNIGGAESMIMNLYRSIDKSIIQFDFVECSDENGGFDNEILSMGGRIFHCPRYNGRNHFSYVSWWLKFCKEHCDEYKIIHGHIGSTASIYLAIAKKYGWYTIAHSHNSNIGYSLKGILFHLFSYQTRYIADQLFACSESAGKARYGKDADFIIIHNAIDTNVYRYNEELRDDYRKSFGISDCFVLGHVGRFEKQKNHDFLLDIFQCVHKINPKTALLLVGDGNLRKDIEKKTEQLGVSDSVIFTGIREDIPALLSAMDVMVFPSLYEGLPVTLVEAQSTGLPCMISDNVPFECALVPSLVSVMHLSDPVEQWAKQVLSKRNETRISRQKELKDCGYDIVDNAKWLEKYYWGIIHDS